MPNELAKKGAQPSRPTKYAVLWHNNFYQGTVTQRNPLRSNLGHIEEEFYGNQVCFLDGVNVEISSRLTPTRRPGNTQYNSQSFPAINRFYENRTNTYNASQTIPSENIQVVADTASVIYDCTGPSTKKTLFTKTAGAGSTYFQSVGNSLYFTDGVDRKKLLTPSLIWAASTAFSLGQYIVDPNGNLQEVTASSGTSGGSVPSWNATPGGFTTDGALTWQNLGSTVQNWQINFPTTVPTLAPGTGEIYWYPRLSVPTYYAVLDQNENVQINGGYVGGGPGVTGGSFPNFSSTLGGSTLDGTAIWINEGLPQKWVANYPLFSYNGGSGVVCLLDSNNNLQVLTSGVTAATTTGSSQPSWSSTPGATTSDGATVVWTCYGPGVTITTGSYQWSYSYHGVDGSLTTASPISGIYSGILGSSSTTFSITVSGPGTTDPQCDQIWIWRTVQGGSVLFFDGSVPNPGAGTSVATPWTYTDTVPDVSTNGGPSLNEFIEAPIALSSNPPPVGLTSLTYHLGCIFGAVGNLVQYSDGPLVTSGNGNTAWNPGNVFVFPSTVVRLFPTSSGDRKSTRLNSSHITRSRMPSSA